MRTVGETQVFMRQVAAVMSDAVRWELIGYLSENPEAGDVIPGSGGLRKLRWEADLRGKGTRGGARVIYYVFDLERPLYLLAVYAKGEAENLSPAGLQALMKMADAIRKATA